MFFSLDAKVICIQVCWLAGDVFLFFCFYSCSMRWKASMIRVDLPLLPLKLVVFVVVDVECYSWSCNVTTACCYMLPNRKGIWCYTILQPKLMLLICFNPLKETYFMNLSESFFNSLEARLILQTGPPKPQGTVYAEQPLLIYFQS